MAKLSRSFRSKNRTTRQFREQYARLPEHIRKAVRATCAIFDADPNHRSLRSDFLKSSSSGKHLQGSISISISMAYRAIYVVEDDLNIWYWIGSHADYDRFIVD